jgi:cation:H+ antiporter
MHAFSMPLLVLLFAASAALVWKAGSPLASTTASLSQRFGLGEALGGMLLLAIATNLPELAIVISASLRGDLGLAVGNLLGGTGAQMMVLVALDRAMPRGTPPLATQAATGALKGECLLVMLLLALAVAAPVLVPLGSFGPLTLPDLLVPALWLAALLWIGRLRPVSAGAGGAAPAPDAGKGTIATFTIAAVATLAGGFGLETIGDLLANRAGVNGVLFGATILAAATSLPELATGWPAAKAGERELAVSDIVGGNAVLPVLLTPASLIAGASAYAAIDRASIGFGALGVAMTAVYLVALVLRPRRRVAGFGPDVLVLTLVYAGGLAAIILFA